jgi:hypothetical protein
MSRRDVDEEITDLAFSDGLQVFAYGVEVETRNERPGLDDMPGSFDEGAQRFSGLQDCIGIGT